MILWFTGNSESGKTTLAKKFDAVLLDGDELRDVWGGDLTKAGRINHNIKVAKLAALLDRQGLFVVVAVICPYQELRQQVYDICKCDFIYTPGGKEGAEFPYEIPTRIKCL